MLPCKSCKTLIDRKEARENDGFCASCNQLQADRTKVSNDLLTSFGGKGRRGLVQWLRKGKFLQGIENDADIHRHNDRVDVIEALIGGPMKFDRLLDEFTKVVLVIAKEETEANE